MQIANPVYDVVFKYLMDDNTIAKKIISLIIGEEIERLDFQPTEYSDDVDKGNRSLTVYRLDFAATVRLPDGTCKRIIIEIQKAKFSTDIMRFRNYLGKQYSNKNNVYDQDSRQKACPILSIYFLGHRLDNIHVPVTRVERKYYDNATGEELSVQEEFIESLTNDSFVIQIPELGRKRRNLTEKVLAVFKQPVSMSTPHFLDICESDYPGEYKEVVMRLIKAASEPQVRKTMDVEDEIIEELGSLERIIAVRDKIIEKQDRELNDKNKALDDKDRLIAELQRQLGNK